MINIRDWWNKEYEYVDRIARQSKNSQSAFFELSRRYLALTDEEKEGVISILIEWIESDDEGKRSDATWLIQKHKILSAKKSMEALCVRLKDSKIPDDPKGYHEREYVLEVLKELS